LPKRAAPTGGQVRPECSCVSFRLPVRRGIKPGPKMRPAQLSRTSNLSIAMVPSPAKRPASRAGGGSLPPYPFWPKVRTTKEMGVDLWRSAAGPRLHRFWCSHFSTAFTSRHRGHCRAAPAIRLPAVGRPSV
jgi:hypothetical protein